MPTVQKAPASRKKAARNLKVFAATLGFYDTVVAAPSQAAALRAWGSHQNLFADGVARLTEDGQAIEAALAQPEVVLRRAVGTTDPFGLDPGIPRIPGLSRGRKKRPAKTNAGLPEAPPRLVDRAGVEAAEAALADLEKAHRVELDDLAARRKALEAEQRRVTERFDKERTRMQAHLERERKAYTKAGGRLD